MSWSHRDRQVMPRTISSTPKPVSAVVKEYSAARSSRSSWIRQPALRSEAQASPIGRRTWRSGPAHARASSREFTRQPLRPRSAD